jgi:hypothetical protein
MVLSLPLATVCTSTKDSVINMSAIDKHASIEWAGCEEEGQKRAMIRSQGSRYNGETSRLNMEIQIRAVAGGGFHLMGHSMYLHI